MVLSQDKDKMVTIETFEDLVKTFETENADGKCESNALAKPTPESYEKIKKSLCAVPYKRDFPPQLQKLPEKVVYDLWESMFFEMQPMVYDNIADGMTKVEIAQRENKGKYLGALTDYVLSTYRKDVIITDKFLCKMFEHGLDKQIIYLLETQKFFKVALKENTLDDACLALACDLTNVKVFTKLLPTLRIDHIEYATRYAAYDFLMLMWKMRKWIPGFVENIKILDKTMTNKTWKQVKFFDWVKEYS